MISARKRITRAIVIILVIVCFCCANELSSLAIADSFVLTHDPQEQHICERHYFLGSGLVPDAFYDHAISTPGSHEALGNLGIGAVDLPIYVGSLSKIKSKEEIERWQSQHPGPYLIGDKLDRVSLLLYYDQQGKLTVFSRGNSRKGFLLHHLAAWLCVPRGLRSLLSVVSWSSLGTSGSSW